MDNRYILQNTLNELGIKSYSDYVKNVEIWDEFDTRVFHGGQEKLSLLRDAAKLYYDNYQKQQREGQFIIVDPADFSDNQISNYMCLFPKRSLIETEPFLTYFDSTPFDCEMYYMAPNDFYNQYFRFRELINRNVAYLYPVYQFGSEYDNGKQEGIAAIYDYHEVRPINNAVKVSQKGNFNRIVQSDEMFYLAFPWLYNARTEDYCEICDRYPAEFDALALAVEKIALSNDGQQDFKSNVLFDMKEALTNIRISYEKRQAELLAKGIAAVVGITLTCIPLLTKELFCNFDPTILSTIIGSATLVDSKALLNDFLSIKTESHLNPYWVLWEWKHKSEKKSHLV